MTRLEALAAAEREFGAIKHSLPVYWRGAVCWRIFMLWPLRWLHRVPPALLALAGDYAHDARQYAISIRKSGRAA